MTDDDPRFVPGRRFCVVHASFLAFKVDPPIWGWMSRFRLKDAVASDERPTVAAYNRFSPSNGRLGAS